MGPVEVLRDGDVMGWKWGAPPEQTDACENITSRRTTYAGSNYIRWSSHVDRHLKFIDNKAYSAIAQIQFR